jgi:ASC-1-like (ASCH) protein
MKTYQNHRADPYFTFLKNGVKTIEGRVKKDWYRYVTKGDHIIVNNEGDTESFETVVQRVTTYTSIKSMLENEELKKLLPDAESIEHGVKIYRRFYTLEQEREFGVVAIEVKVK